MASQIVDEAAARPVNPTGHQQQASTPDSSRPMTLSEAASALDFDYEQWRDSPPPSSADWPRLRLRLAHAEQAAMGLVGVSSVLREHHFASEQAKNSGVEYLGINDFKAGGISDAQEALAWMLYEHLVDLRTTITKENGHD